MKTFIGDTRRWGMRVALWNARFNLAYRLGGFTRASK